MSSSESRANEPAEMPPGDAVTHPSEEIGATARRQDSEATLSPNDCDIDAQAAKGQSRRQQRKPSYRSRPGYEAEDAAIAMSEYGGSKHFMENDPHTGDQSYNMSATAIDGELRPPMLRHANTSISNHENRDSTVILEQKLPRAFRIASPDAERRNGHVQNFYKEAVQRRIKHKNLLIAAVSEFCGTFLFLLFAEAIATTVSNRADQLKAQAPSSVPDLQGLLFSSLGFGFSLCISVWIFFRISGGVQNPAITLALTLAGAMDISKCICLTLAQFAGGITASALVACLLPGTVNARTTLGEGVNVAQGFWIEFFLTTNLIFTVLMLAAEKHRGTFLAPVGIGLALFITQLFGQPYTGASCNPARSLGPDVVTGKFNDYTWIYYVAPYCAAVFVWAFYYLLKWLRYETAAEGQDDDGHGVEAKIQVVKDAYGNIIGALELISKADYRPLISNEDDDVELGTAKLERSNTFNSMVPENASSQPLKRSLTGNTVGRGRSASMQSVVETAPPSKRQSTYPGGLSPPPSIVTVPALPLPNPAAMQATAGPGLSMNQSGDEEIISPSSTIDSRPRPASYSFTSRGAGAHPSAGIDRHRPESFESLATIKRPHRMN